MLKINGIRFFKVGLGKILTTGDVNNSEISRDADQYIEVQNGSDLYLTIDVNIQMILEKYLQKGVDDNGATARFCNFNGP